MKKTKMKDSTAKRVIVSYASGETDDAFASYEGAVEMLESRFEGLAIGHDGDLDGGGDRTLFWLSSSDAEDDDGCRAAGKIMWE